MERYSVRVFCASGHCSPLSDHVCGACARPSGTDPPPTLRSHSYSAHLLVNTLTVRSGKVLSPATFKSPRGTLPLDSSPSVPTMASSGNETPDRILPLSLCRLTPQGVASVIYHLRQHSTFADVTEERLQAMAFAFLAQGGTNDNNHVVSPNHFHHVHYEAHTSTVGCTWRNQMRDFYVELVMDMVSQFLILLGFCSCSLNDVQVTWLDRLSGGATVLVHSPGNRLPGTWSIPEEARLNVFLPFVLLHERPALRAVFAHLVQYFAQYVATAAMERWDFVTSLDDDSLDDPTPPHWVSNRGVGQPLIPDSDTPRRIFYGRRAGVVDLLIAAEGLDQAPPPTPPVSSPSLPSLTPSALPSPIVAPSAPPKNLNVAYTVAHERKMSPVPHNGKPHRSIEGCDDDSRADDDGLRCSRNSAIRIRLATGG